ncbi:MAG: cytochrome c biogenesis CcdA family protein [Cyanobacteria bacterium RUI128]|nr:cytochrome c biogenesis CcdA family protein [Cyanobacteria bacterium RUI128]
MIDISNYFVAQASVGNFQLMFILFSFLGGVLASISPCSLAMLPIVIGYIGGYGGNDNKKIFWQLMSFIIGSALVFSIIGVFCALTGKVFISYAGNYFLIILASFLLALGLHLLGILELNFPALINKIPQNRNNSKFLYPMLLGAIFAIAGTPCSTPILAGIMSFAAITNSILLSVIMLFSFALGQGLILVIAGMFTGLIKKFGSVVSLSEMLIKFSGVLLILASIYMYYKIFAKFFLF